ncbi:energy transducer TonB [Lacinutrix jangbogonensis]|uniref:hypothetical protein n=1 Tax=Lacinutrix jangbogonensis TaxID=1469557 RepID=UPI00068D9EBA|nr:hypothetical protein [Lacinutrix jangbogonensis]
MKNYIENTNLINAYLNNTLSGSERQAFENRLETDTEFKTLYNEQLAILEGINRIALKAEINAAKQNYVRLKWMKYIGVSVIAILVSALIYSFIFKKETPQTIEPANNNEIEVVSDSVIVEKPSEEKIEEEIVAAEQSKKEIKEKKEAIAPWEKTTSDDTTIEEIVIERPIVKELDPTSPELISFYKSVKKAPQIIEVNTEKEFIITCKEGTVLTIPAKSFVDVKTGKLARGKINLEVTEYYQLSDMLLGNLTTKSDDKQLETGGMLYLDANKKGKKLKLKSGKRIKMAFNNKGKKNMLLFNGEERNEGVNWKLESQEVDKPISVKKIFDNEIIEKDVKVSFSEIDEVPLFQKCKENKDNSTRRYCMENEILKFVESKFNVSIAKDLGLTGAHDITTYFVIETDGTIGEIKIRASRKELGYEMIRVIESLPKLVPGKQNGIAVKTVYYLPFEVLFKGETVKQLPITVRSDKSFDKVSTRLDSVRLVEELNRSNNRDIERYVFESMRLGWINCDRFAKTTNKKVKYKLKIKDSEGTNVKMIFKSMSSILPSTKRNGNYEFGWVPKGEEVILIAIKYKDNKIYLGKQETNTTTVSDLEFKEVTIQELKGELQKLNNSFK